jgi:hypothetical protein
MNFHRYNEENKYIGVTETEPNDDLWTFKEPTGLISPIWNEAEWNEGVTPEELEVINKSKKQSCYIELLETDWYFIRKAETGIEVPIEVLQKRAEIRAKYE